MEAKFNIITIRVWRLVVWEFVNFGSSLQWQPWLQTETRTRNLAARDGLAPGVINRKLEYLLRARPSKFLCPSWQALQLN